MNTLVPDFATTALKRWVVKSTLLVIKQWFAI